MSDQEHLREKQWQQLSSYLDGQVNERERKIIEGQLSGDPELQRAYALLKQNRALLRNLPRRRATRNFTLTAEMAGQKQKSLNRWLLFPALSFASVISLALIILSFVVNPTANTTSLAAAPAAEMAAELDTAAREVNSPPPLIFWGGYQGPAYGYGGSPFAGKGGGGADEPQMLMMTPEPAVPAIGGPVVGVESTPLESAQGAEIAGAEPAAEAEIQSHAEDTSEGAALTGLILGLPPEAERGQKNVQQSGQETGPSQTAEQVRSAQLRWWLIRGALLILSLISAAGAVILWKRRQMMD